MPIGWVISKAGNGKEVYLASMVKRELAQDAMGDEVEDDLDEEVKEKDYLIIEEVEDL